MSNKDKKYNLSLIRAYKIKFGAWSTEIDAAAFDAIQQIQVGGRLVYKEVPEDSRKNDNSPHGYFEYMTPEEVKEFKKVAGARPPSDKPSGKVLITPNKVQNDQDF